MFHVDDWYSGLIFKNRFSRQALTILEINNSMLIKNSMLPTENVDCIQLCAKSNR